MPEPRLIVTDSYSRAAAELHRLRVPLRDVRLIDSEEKLRGREGDMWHLWFFVGGRGGARENALRLEFARRVRLGRIRDMGWPEGADTSPRSTLAEDEIARVREGFARGELTLSSWVYTSQGRYQITKIERRDLVDRDGERELDVRLTLLRKRAGEVGPDRIVVTVLPEHHGS